MLDSMRNRHCLSIVAAFALFWSAACSSSKDSSTDSANANDNDISFDGVATAVWTSGMTIDLTWNAATGSSNIVYDIFAARVVGAQGYDTATATTEADATSYQLAVDTTGPWYVVVRARDADGHTDSNTHELSVTVGVATPFLYVLMSDDPYMYAYSFNADTGAPEQVEDFSYTNVNYPQGLATAVHGDYVAVTACCGSGDHPTSTNMYFVDDDSPALTPLTPDPASDDYLWTGITVGGAEHPYFWGPNDETNIYVQYKVNIADGSVSVLSPTVNVVFGDEGRSAIADPVTDGLYVLTTDALTLYEPASDGLLAEVSSLALPEGVLDPDDDYPVMGVHGAGHVYIATFTAVLDANVAVDGTMTWTSYQQGMDGDEPIMADYVARDLEQEGYVNAFVTHPSGNYLYMVTQPLPVSDVNQPAHVEVIDVSSITGAPVVTLDDEKEVYNVSSSFDFQLTGHYPWDVGHVAISTDGKTLVAAGSAKLDAALVDPDDGTLSTVDGAPFDLPLSAVGMASISRYVVAP